jgi:hypothetical protein
MNYGIFQLRGIKIQFPDTSRWVNEADVVVIEGRSPVAYAAGNTIKIPETKIPVVKEADIVVIGSGPAGFGAATTAARLGADTVLIERFGATGGITTNALQGHFFCEPGLGGGLYTELYERYLHEHVISECSEKEYPGLPGNPVFHFHKSPIGGMSGGKFSFHIALPDPAAIVWLQMMEEANVKFMFRTLFVDAVIGDNMFGDNSIEAVIVENPSGRQAIRGKIFVDASGTANVVVRAGAPYKPGGGSPFTAEIPGGLMWRMCGVDFDKLYQYQTTQNDPELAKLIEAAKAAGDIPDILYRPRPCGGDLYGELYIGHPTLDFSPMGPPGDWQFWMNWPYEWDLRPDESGEDLTRAEVEMRKLILAEWKFLKKYVPGFENSYIVQIAPYMGIRDGCHPMGEYVLTLEDLINNRKFPDAVITKKGIDRLDFSMPSAHKTVHEFDVPYRCFLPKRINNLLLSGASMSFSQEILFYHMRGFQWSLQSGEIAATAAVKSLEQGIAPKDYKWVGKLY